MKNNTEALDRNKGINRVMENFKITPYNIVEKNLRRATLKTISAIEGFQPSKARG